MFYDARITIGMMFTLIGTILAAFGLGTRDNLMVYEKSLGINLNLWWGLVLLVFGVVVLLIGRSSQLKVEKQGNQKGKTGSRE